MGASLNEQGGTIPRLRAPLVISLSLARIGRTARGWAHRSVGGRELQLLDSPSRGICTAACSSHDSALVHSASFRSILTSCTPRPVARPPPSPRNGPRAPSPALRRVPRAVGRAVCPWEHSCTQYTHHQLLYSSHDGERVENEPDGGLPREPEPAAERWREWMSAVGRVGVRTGVRGRWSRSSSGRRVV